MQTHIESGNTDEKLVAAAICRQLTEADIIRASLEQNGIEFWTDGEQFAQTQYALNAFARIKIQVRQSDAERAAAIIQSLELQNSSFPMKNNIWSGLIFQPIPLVIILCILIAILNAFFGFF